MAEHDDVPAITCDVYDIPNCEFGRGRPRPHPICCNHAVEYFISEDASDLVGLTLEEPRVVRALMGLSKKGWSKILTEDGAAIVDWPRLLDKADKAHAFSVLGDDWLFDQEAVSAAAAARETIAHPKTADVAEGEKERHRLYANAYILHLMVALVSFMLKHHRKPKGDEFHEWLNLAWTRYVDAAGLREGTACLHVHVRLHGRVRRRRARACLSVTSVYDCGTVLSTPPALPSWAA